MISDEQMEEEALDALEALDAIGDPAQFLGDDVPDIQLDELFASLLNVIEPEVRARVLQRAFPNGISNNDQRSKIDAAPITHLTLDESYGVTVTFHTSRESALQTLVWAYHDWMLDLGISEEDEDQQDKDSIIRGCFFAAYDAKNWEEAWKIIQSRIRSAEETVIIELAQTKDGQAMNWRRRIH